MKNETVHGGCGRGGGGRFVHSGGNTCNIISNILHVAAGIRACHDVTQYAIQMYRRLGVPFGVKNAVEGVTNWGRYSGLCEASRLIYFYNFYAIARLCANESTNCVSEAQVTHGAQCCTGTVVKKKIRTS